MGWALFSCSTCKHAILWRYKASSCSWRSSLLSPTSSWTLSLRFLTRGWGFKTLPTPQHSSTRARWKGLPIIKDVTRPVGLQPAMLIARLIITIGFLLTALFAPMIAPYSWAQTSAEFGSFGTQQPPSSTNIWGTTVSGFDVFSRVIWGTRTAVAVIVAAVAASMIL